MGNRFKGEGSGGALFLLFRLLALVGEVVTVIVMLACLPPAARVGGEKVAAAPAGRPAVEKFTL